MAAMTENSKRIFNYMKENYGQEFTAQDIASALDLATATVNGSITGLARKGLAKRVDKEVMKPTIVKICTLTDEGLDFDPDTEVAE